MKKQSHREEKDGLEEEKEAALHEELEAHCIPSSLPKLNGRPLEAEEKAFSENLDPEVSTTAELLNRVLEFRPLHLIKREREKIFVYMHVCVCYMFFSAVDKKVILNSFNILYSIESKTLSIIREHHFVYCQERRKLYELSYNTSVIIIRI